MDIENLSVQTLRMFVSEGLITNIPSIFELSNKKDELLALPGFGSKSVDNLLQAIEKAKRQDLGRFLFALGIRHLGEKLSHTLAKRFGSLEAITKATKEELSTIRDFGDSLTESVVSYFSDDANIKMLNELVSHGINFNEIAKPTSNVLSGKTFVITGTLSKPRDHFKSLIELNGGNTSGSVSRNTSFVLAGEEAGSKLAKAEELQVKVIGEEEFLEMIGENNG